MRSKRLRRRASASQRESPFFEKVTAQHDVLPAGTTGFFQPKLAVGRPGDAFEQEADAVADNVVNHPAQVEGAALGPKEKVQRQAAPDEEMQTGLQPKGMEEREEAVMRQSTEEKEETVRTQAADEEEKTVRTQAADEEEKTVRTQAMDEEDRTVRTQAAAEEETPTEAADEEEATVQTKAADTQAPPLSARLTRERGKGSPLPPGTKAEMEASFGTDFSGVRVHTDDDAVQMNSQLRAHAFTSGRDIFFNEGTFEPGTQTGKRLLAHELTHVVQQQRKH